MTDIVNEICWTVGICTFMICFTCYLCVSERWTAFTEVEIERVKREYPDSEYEEV